jgi:type 2A phosphatase activator TIP41
MAAIPEHQLFESPNVRSIEVNGWTITASTNPISNAFEIDELQRSLGLPLPEMTFGNNYLTLEHRASKRKYAFTAENALREVKTGELGEGDGGVKVGYADTWLKSRYVLSRFQKNPLYIVRGRTHQSSLLPMPANVTTKSYDWTYTTTYTGHSSQFPWHPTIADEPTHSIPFAELTRPDPILFYAEIPLFEDELHDNGSSNLLIRIVSVPYTFEVRSGQQWTQRVMPTCFFILSRFTLRVDNVLFRTHDTRIYHSFNSKPPLIIRETSGWEASYETVRAILAKKNDLSPLTDPSFVAKTLADLPPQISQEEGAGTRWRGMGTKLEVSILE